MRSEVEKLLSELSQLLIGICIMQVWWGDRSGRREGWGRRGGGICFMRRDRGRKGMGGGWRGGGTSTKGLIQTNTFTL